MHREYRGGKEYGDAKKLSQSDAPERGMGDPYADETHPAENHEEAQNGEQNGDNHPCD